MTVARFALRIRSVCVSRIVTGAGPHSNVMIPPLATAAARAAEVQLAAVPRPTTRAGFEVSTARPAAGTGTRPVRTPGSGSVPPAASAAPALVVADGVAVPDAGDGPAPVGAGVSAARS